MRPWWLFLAAGLALPSCTGTIGDSLGGGGSGDEDDQPAQVGAEFECQDTSAQDPGPSVIRRLTNAEYVRTVRDAIGVDVADLVTQLPVEQTADGFVNNTATQVTSVEGIEAYAALADRIVERIVELDAFVAMYAPCAEFTVPCEDGFIDAMGLKLFRRPPSAEEKASLRPIFEVAMAEGDGFSQAAGLVTTAMLQSPRFLYRMESPTTGMLDDHEIASRLSYLVWGSSPDEELYRAAAAGELIGDEGFRAQLERMLASERAREYSHDFLHGWLDLTRLRELNSPLAGDMRMEADAFFDRVIWEDGAGLPALYSTALAFATPELAALYGFPDPAPGLAPYDTSDIAGRRGLLTQAAVLSAGGSSGSLVFRGKFILEQFLCAEVPPPPPGVSDQRPEVEPGMSQRYYSEQRLATPACQTCHSAMDPLAYPFTVFDPLGAPRSVDEAGNELATDGVFVTPYRPEGIPYGSTDEFIALFAADERVRDCLLLKNAQFAYGRDLLQADACSLAGARELAVAGEMTYPAVVQAIALQPSFRRIRAE